MDANFNPSCCYFLMMLFYIDININQHKMETSHFRQACMDGDIETLKTFLGAIDHHQLQQNDELLNLISNGIILASIYGHFEIVKFLCEMEEFMPEDERSNCLTYAMTNGHLEIVKYFHAKCTHDDFWMHMLALSFACAKGYYDIVEYLVERFPDHQPGNINMDSAKYWSLVHSYKGKHRKMFKYLVTKFSGFDFSEDDKLIKIADDIYKRGDLELIKHLHNNNIKIANGCGHYFFTVCEHGHVEALEWMHETGQDIRMQNDRALQDACTEGHLAVVKWLHEHGCDIRINDEILLDTAACRGHQDIVTYLLANGCEL